MIPVPTPDQSMHVLRILGEWNKRGWTYEVQSRGPNVSIVDYTDPSNPTPGCELRTEGVNHFDAICNATTVMQLLLEEYPYK